LAVLVLASALVALAALARPRWFFNTTTLSFAVRHFGRAYQPAWGVLSLDVASPSLLEKDVALRAADFCFKAASGSTQGCVKSLDALVSVRVGMDGLHVARVQRFLLTGDHLLVDERQQASGPAKGAEAPFALPSLLPESLRGLELDGVAVSLPSMEILQTGATLKGGLEVDFKPGEKRPLRIRAQIDRASGGITRHYAASAVLDSDFLENRGLSFADGDARLSGDDGTRVRLNARVAQAGPREIKLTFTATARRGPWRLAASGRASQTPEAYAGSAEAEVSASSGPLKSFSLRPLVFSASLDPGSRRPRDLVLNARFSVEPGSLGSALGRDLAKSIRGRASLKARATPTLGRKDHFDAVLSVAFEPIKSWYEIDGRLEAALSGRTSRLTDAAIKEKGDFELKVARFDDLVKFLSGTAYAVPAPLAELGGPLRLEVHSRGERGLDAQDVRYALNTDLRGRRQRLKMSVDGTLAVSRLAEPERAFKNSASVDLQDIALQMPALSVKGMPSVARDARIRLSSPNAAAVSGASAFFSTGAFVSEVRVRTSKPVVIYSNLTTTPMPVAIELTAAGPPAALAGVVAFQSFSVKFFRREAVVDHFRFSWAPGSKAIAIDGLVTYRTPDATVNIRLSGTTAKPQVDFESNPPYSRQEIIALLLFGTAPDELDPDQLTTVANTQTAVSKDAFGLTSLYLFASTPIEFVGYDPIARAYTMKFRLPGGMSLSVGSSAALTENLTLRKRLAAHWAVETEAGRSDVQGNVVTTLLEWFNRY
jgi:hypothetical protein